MVSITATSRLGKFDKAECDAYKEIAWYKWQDRPYKCKLCGHDACFEGAKPYSRRCSKCKKDDSPTAGTAFGKIRLPMDVCISLVKLLLTSDERPTVNEIVKQLTSLTGRKVLAKALWELTYKIYSRIPREMYADSSFTYDHILMIGMFDSGTQYALIKSMLKKNCTYRTMTYKDEPELQKVFLKQLTPTAHGSLYFIKHLNWANMKIWKRETGLEHIEYNSEEIISMAKEFRSWISGIDKNYLTHRDALIAFYLFKKNGHSYSELMELLCKSQ